MTGSFHRRDFLAASAAAGAGLLAAGRLEAAPWKTELRKAMIDKPDDDTLKRLKDAGFDGIESNDRAATPEQAAAARMTADRLGMRIHSVLYGWAKFNQSEDDVQKDLAGVTVALRACQAYGADTVLLVPCRIGGKGKDKQEMDIPEAWEFDIRFDEKTGHLKQVVAGDNTRYQQYIEAHNHASDTSREAVKKLIPVAEQTGVVIALENVWNNLWVKPDFFQNFVASFNHPMIKAYFDIGNHVKYAPPQEWIHTLGKLIAKCHIKDFNLDRNKPRGGDFVHPREGSIDWPAVRKALDDVGYNGWLTIEDRGLPLEEFNKRLDLIIAGQ